MIFIIGVSPRIKESGHFSTTCPACHRAVSMGSCKQQNVVTLFFIPVIPLGGKYIATCGSCASMMDMSSEAGKAVERSAGIYVSPNELNILRNNAGLNCASCGARVEATQNFCPNCGSRLL